MATTAETEVLKIAESQLGLFTTKQADEVGFGEQMRRTRLARGSIRRVHWNVYCFGGHELTEAGKHLASVLAVDREGTRSSHRAAAWLWGMTPFPQKPEITITDYARVRVKDVRVHRTETLLLEPEVRLGVPTTTAAETLLDLGAVKGLRHVQAALDRGIASKIVTPVSALAELDRRGRAGVRGTAALRRLLDQAGITGSHHPSVLEAKMRRLITRAGLPQPACELTVGQNGEYRLDFCWPELMLAVEVDGWMYHSSFGAFVRNKTRKNSLTIAGYSIIEYTWVHVTKTPQDVVRQLKTAYAARTRLFSGHIALPSNGS